MALQIVDTNRIGTGVVIDLGQTDDVFVSAGTTLASTSLFAIRGLGNGHLANIQGTVVSPQDGSTIILGLNGSSSGQQLVIGKGGYVAGMSDTTYSVVLRGQGSLVENDGTIWADGSAIMMEGTGARLSKIVNRGLIDSGDAAITRRQATDTETLSIENSGTIRASWAAFWGNWAPGTTKIANTGSMFGDVGFGRGNDVYDGSAGRLTGKVYGDDGIDTITGGIDNDFFLGEAGHDVLNGGVGNDTLDGGSGNDRLTGGGGVDKMIGGADDDVYMVDDILDIVDEQRSGSGGVDMVNSVVTFSLADGATVLGAVENLTLGGSAAINATGNALANSLLGNSAANVLDGGAGADSMYGGWGNDTYVVDHAGDVVDEQTYGSDGIDTVRSSVTFSLANSAKLLGAVENLTLVGTAAINGTGNALANVLVGNAAANVLNGGAGADTMRGGGGNDTYVVERAGDIVDEGTAGSSSTDTVQSSVTFSLVNSAGVRGAVENLTLTGTAAINGMGNALANVVTGNAVANVLDGGAGNDVLKGAAGNDTLKGGLGNDVFVVSTVPNASTGKDTITDFANGTGNDDSFHIDNAVFAKLGANGALNAGFFKAGTSAADANDYLVYNKASGALFYDPDGSGAGAAVQFAVLAAKPVLSASDFIVC